MRHLYFRIVLSSIYALGSFGGGMAVGQTAPQEHVEAIKPPATPLPAEATSRGVTKFSFIAYGDTRGRRDGATLQYEHSLIVDSMLAQIKKLQTTDYPVRFVLQSGDAVEAGATVWAAAVSGLVPTTTSSTMWIPTPDRKLPRIKPNYRRRVLRLPDLDYCKTAVLNILGLPASRRVYEYAIDQFIAWYLRTAILQSE